MMGSKNAYMPYTTTKPKIEAGKMELALQPTEPVALLENIQTLFGEAATAKGLTLSLDLDPALPAQLLVDPLRLGQCVSNLVSNAIKFTKRNGKIDIKC